MGKAVNPWKKEKQCLSQLLVIRLEFSTLHRWILVAEKLSGTGAPAQVPLTESEAAAEVLEAKALGSQ